MKFNRYQYRVRTKQGKIWYAEYQKHWWWPFWRRLKKKKYKYEYIKQDPYYVDQLFYSQSEAERFCKTHAQNRLDKFEREEAKRKAEFSAVVYLGELP